MGIMGSSINSEKKLGSSTGAGVARPHAVWQEQRRVRRRSRAGSEAAATGAGAASLAKGDQEDAGASARDCRSRWLGVAAVGGGTGTVTLAPAAAGGAHRSRCGAELVQLADVFGQFFHARSSLLRLAALASSSSVAFGPLTAPLRG
jgi:hypothetical protein